MNRCVPSLLKLRWEILLAVAACVTLAGRALGQTAAPPAQSTTLKTPAYDVVSIRPHKPTSDGSSWGAPTADGYEARNYSVRELIAQAYEINSSYQLAGLPSWASEEPFDLEARLDDDAAAAYRKLSDRERREQAAPMLRSMLADRFRLKVHHETRELPVYALVQAKSGFKLKQAQGAENLYGMFTNRGLISIRGGPIGARFIVGLSNFVGRIVVDRTGLTGYYDITLKWTPDGSQTSDPNAPPDLFTALEEQLGLKLVATRAPVDVLVIDHVERPTEN
jgi:uncharacterized protein (TIGR03435 family)